MRKILTWHPMGKAGAYILKKDYAIVTNFILSNLNAQEMTLLELIEHGEHGLASYIEKNIAWHILVVKLDLEARGILVSFIKLAPHKTQFLKLRRKELQKFIPPNIDLARNREISS